MQTSKRVLLNLIFAFSIVAIFILLIINILNSVKLPWWEGDTGVSFIFGWIAFGYFILAAISSFCWIRNIGNGFWLWKLPTMLFLPFSIPFLIIVYCEKNKNGQIKIIEN